MWLACGAALMGAALAPPVLAQTPRGLDRLSHILVLYLENRSFDNLFGEFPGANGISQAGDAAMQRDRDGKPFETLPSSARPFDRPKNPQEVNAIEAWRVCRTGPSRPSACAPGVTAADAHARPHPRLLYQPHADPRRQERPLRRVLERRRRCRWATTARPT